MTCTRPNSGYRVYVADPSNALQSQTMDSAMRTLRLCGWLAGAAVALLSAACGGNNVGGPAKTKVAFVSNNPEDFWTIAEAGTKKAADELGVEVFFKRPQNGTAAEQKQIIEDLLARRVQAIAVSVIDPDNQI